MITLTAKINLISSGGAYLSLGADTLSPNNISSGLGAIIGFKKEVGNPFIIGASKLGDGSTFSDKVDYFISNALYRKDKGFFVYGEDGKDQWVADSYSITIQGTKNFTSLTIAFDTQNNRHPNTIKIDNVEYADDDAIFTISGLSNTNSHTIVIDNWNADGYPIVISGIFVELSIDIDRRNLIALSRKIMYRADNSLPSYGILSNTGSLEFNDSNGEVKDYAEQLLLTSDLKVDIWLKNTLTNTEVQVGSFETDTWDYDNDNRSVSVSLRDDLEEWQDIHIDGINFDPRKPFKIIIDGKMENFYRWLQGRDSNGNYRTPQKYKMLSFDELDDKTKTILQNTIVQYPLLENGTLWEQWTKICQVCGLYIYKNNEGRTVCSYTYGS